MSVLAPKRIVPLRDPFSISMYIYKIVNAAKAHLHSIADAISKMPQKSFC